LANPIGRNARRRKRGKGRLNQKTDPLTHNQQILAGYLNIQYIPEKHIPLHQVELLPNQLAQQHPVQHETVLGCNVTKEKTCQDKTEANNPQINQDIKRREGLKRKSFVLRKRQEKKQRILKDGKPTQTPSPEIVPSSVSWEVLPAETWFYITCKLDNPRDLMALELTSKTFRGIAGNRWNTFAKDFFPDVLPVLQSPMSLSQRKSLFYSIWSFSNDHSLVYLDDGDVGWTCPVCSCVGETSGFNELKMEEGHASYKTLQCENCLDLYKHTFKWTFDTQHVYHFTMCPSYAFELSPICDYSLREACLSLELEGDCSCEDIGTCDQCAHCEQKACVVCMESCEDCDMDQCSECRSKGQCSLNSHSGDDSEHEPE